MAERLAQKIELSAEIAQNQPLLPTGPRQDIVEFAEAGAFSSHRARSCRFAKRPSLPQQPPLVFLPGDEVALRLACLAKLLKR
jgi:hypothetical protein